MQNRQEIVHLQIGMAEIHGNVGLVAQRTNVLAVETLCNALSAKVVATGCHESVRKQIVANGAVKLLHQNVQWNL